MKTRLRSQKLLERLAHHPDEKQHKDALIVKKLLRLLEIKRTKVIMFYLPIHGEVDLRKLFEKLIKHKKFVLPRMNGKKLDLYLVESLNDTEKGKFKIFEPKKSLKKIKPVNIDAVLIPGVVFSKNGHRIGYGKGFYDRLLKKMNCVKVGIAYQFQIVDNVPGQPHDVPMDMIVTEQRIIRMKANSSTKAASLRKIPGRNIGRKELAFLKRPKKIIL